MVLGAPGEYGQPAPRPVVEDSDQDSGSARLLKTNARGNPRSPRSVTMARVLMYELENN